LRIIQNMNDFKIRAEINKILNALTYNDIPFNPTKCIIDYFTTYEKFADVYIFEELFNSCATTHIQSIWPNVFNSSSLAKNYNCYQTLINSIIYIIKLINNVDGEYSAIVPPFHYDCTNRIGQFDYVCANQCNYRLKMNDPAIIHINKLIREHKAAGGDKIALFESDNIEDVKKSLELGHAPAIVKLIAMTGNTVPKSEEHLEYLHKSIDFGYTDNIIKIAEIYDSAITKVGDQIDDRQAKIYYDFYAFKATTTELGARIANLCNFYERTNAIISGKMREKMCSSWLKVNGKNPGAVLPKLLN
jgi:hypothetical protein